MPLHTTLESLDPAQRALLVELRSKFPDVPEKDALRFLIARKFELLKAAAFLQADVDWRKSYAPSEVTQARVPRALPSGCWRSPGTMQCDGLNVAVVWVQLSLWWPDQYDVPEYLSLLVYFLEKLSQESEQFVILFDMDGWRFSHSLHLRKMHAQISTLQEHYPERLRAALLVGTPGIFYATWRLIKPWLDPVTAAKVHFLPSQSDAQAAALLQLVDAAVLPARYGGALQAGDMPVPGLKGQPTVVVLDAAGQPVTAAAKTGN